MLGNSPYCQSVKLYVFDAKCTKTLSAHVPCFGISPGLFVSLYKAASNDVTTEFRFRPIRSRHLNNTAFGAAYSKRRKHTRFAEVERSFGATHEVLLSLSSARKTVDFMNRHWRLTSQMWSHAQYFGGIWRAVARHFVPCRYYLGIM